MFCYRFYYRIIKEKIGYEGEIEKKRTEVQKMIDQKKDSHDINKQVSFFYPNLLYVLVNLLIYVVHNLNFYKQKEVLAESEMMIPDCLKRLDKGILDLENFLKVSFLFFILIFLEVTFIFMLHRTSVLRAHWSRRRKWRKPERRSLTARICYRLLPLHLVKLFINNSV